jgi:uncharacterized protein
VKLTAPRISHLSHQVLDALCAHQFVQISSRADALAALKDSLEKQVSSAEAIDAVVRDKLRKQSKIPGSREWQILYDKYCQEERAKQRW